jgi:hypothetical protein
VNLPQRLVLLVGAFLTLIICLFPPWQYVYRYQRAEQSSDLERPTFGPAITRQANRNAGYHLVFRSVDLNTPDLLDPDNPSISVRIDRERITVELIGVLFPTAMLCLLFIQRRNSN